MKIDQHVFGCFWIKTSKENSQRLEKYWRKMKEEEETVIHSN